MFFIFIIPVSIIFILLVGLVLGAFFMAFASTIIFILLNKYNKFSEWKSDTRKYVRYIGYISYYALIIMMIISYIGIGIVAYFYFVPVS